MVVLILLATLWGVVQLVALGSITRSVRVGTVLLATVMGCYACGTVAVGIQLAWTRAYAAATGRPLYQVVQRAGYTVDPVIEEVVKVLPLVIVVLLCRRFRTQWGLTDYLLLGGGLGAGFTFAEAMLRYGARAARAYPSRGGFDVSTGLFGSVHVPGLADLVHSWLPAPAQGGGLFGLGDTSHLDLHLAYTALAGFGVGVVLRLRGRSRWLGLLPLAYSCLDHAAYNYGLGTLGVSGPFVGAVVVLHQGLWLGPLLALVAAAGIDLRILRATARNGPELLLAGERTALDTAAVLHHLARRCAPWTASIGWRFVLVRRSARYAMAHPTGTTHEVAATTAQLARAIDRARDPGAWQDARRRLGLRLVRRRLLTRWPVVLWAVLVAPVTLYYLVGAVPIFSAVQGWLARPTAFAVVVVMSAIGLGWLGWQTVVLLRRLPGSAHHGWGEPAIRLSMRLLGAVGALAAGTALIVAWALGVRDGAAHVVPTIHVLDALGAATMVGALLLALLALFTFPPLGLVAVEGMGAVLVWTGVTAELTAALGASALLGTSGYLLNEAGNGSSGGASSPRIGPQTRAERLEELARDPAHGDRVSDKTLREAEVGLEMEEQGALRGPIRRASNPGAEFVDANGTEWDVKGYHSEVTKRGKLDVNKAYRMITREMSSRTRVILDTKYMSAQDIVELEELLSANPVVERWVLWW